MPIATGLIIDTSDRVFPLNKDAYYCPVGMIGIKAKLSHMVFGKSRNHVTFSFF